MFGLFKSNPTKKMRKELERLQEKAMQMQRNGDIRGSSFVSQEADELWQKIQAIEAQQKAQAKSLKR
ncbi:DUF6435 family protein [Pseudidiomarina taiwanensis]|uniref:Lacal_2735 family protein n=1 Tax=Pseudidiomarina taiwanensis TaxID=337250 RepID=A0A432ZFX2_9GAMM|nr:DUF6435 family protein [Pseudidiomarina taiwanensis]RUO76866.1 hypothetical protein CWI83_07320 [Pseudidiomarina taiwanensis]